MKSSRRYRDYHPTADRPFDFSAAPDAATIQVTQRCFFAVCRSLLLSPPRLMRAQHMSSPTLLSDLSPPCRYHHLHVADDNRQRCFIIADVEDKTISSASLIASTRQIHADVRDARTQRITSGRRAKNAQ